MTSKSPERTSVDKKENRRASTSKRDASPEPKRARKELTVDDRRRGQRLFGMLLGTLNQRKTEIQNKSSTDIKREEIHKKLQQKISEENSKIAEDVRKENLVRQEVEARRKLANDHTRIANKRANKRESDSKMINYLITNTNPPIYYLPYKLTETQKQKIQDQKEELEKRIEEEIKEEEEWKKQDKEFFASLDSNKNRSNTSGNSSQDKQEDETQEKNQSNSDSPAHDSSDNNKIVEKDCSPNSIFKENDENGDSTEAQSNKDSSATSPKPVEDQSESTQLIKATDKDTQTPDNNETQHMPESKPEKLADSSSNEEESIDSSKACDNEVNTEKIENSKLSETKPSENNNASPSAEQQNENEQSKEVIQD